MLDQPLDHTWRLVAGEIVPDQQQPKPRQIIG